ncbi:MAG: hypothetical protein KBT12_06355 [Bacteroidales bacterium]|nr:hypothetical protein [Candidatus Physcousia equi]
MDFVTNKNNVTIDGEQVTIEYGQDYNELYIYKELAAGEHTIVLSAGSITLDGTVNEKDITVTLNIESPSTGIQRVDNGTTTDGKRLEAGKIVIIKNGIKYSTSGVRI